MSEENTMRPAWIALIALSAACGPDADRYTYGGYDMPNHFPLDGNRLWEYLSDADTEHYTLEVEKTTTTAVSDYEVITVEHTNGDTVESLFQVDWSSDSIMGVKIHGYEDFSSGSAVSFDPTVTFADRQMVPTEALETETGGTTFTATFQGITGCQTHWATDWDDLDCIVMSLEAANGGHTQITGTYTLVPRYGSAYMDLDYYDGTWNLADHTWTSSD